MQGRAEALVQQGLDLHRRGDAAAAGRLYRAALDAEAGNADALYYLAVLAFQNAQFPDAIGLTGRSLASNAAPARTHKLLGHALYSAGRHAEALAALDAALARDPEFAEAHGLRADALAALGRLDEAVAAYDRSLALDPAASADWYNRGAALADLGRHADAVENFSRLIALAPDLAPAYAGRGRALAQLARYDEALADLDRAIALDPAASGPHSDRAIALRNLKREGDALASLDAALAIDPDYRPALAMRANLLVRLARHSEALAICDRLLARDPHDVEARITRSDALAGLGRLAESIADADAVLAVLPGHAGTQWNKSLSLLSLGRFAEGWDLYPSRWAVLGDALRAAHPQPAWDGAHCRGSLLVWGEQGLGDEILYASMIPDLQGRADSIILETESRLVPLFARSFPRVNVIAAAPASAPPIAAEAQIACGDLGRILRRSPQDFPQRPDGYLVADRARADALRKRLAHDGRRVVGLSWRSANPAVGASKTAPLMRFAPLLRLSNVRFVDLQYGDTGAELAEVARDTGVRVEHLPDIDNTRDIDGLAALISACDAVVTVSNTTAHLAGALGKPVFVLIPAGYARIWYWLQDRPDSPWYPRARLFRQATPHQWDDLVARVADELAAALAAG